MSAMSNSQCSKVQPPPPAHRVSVTPRGPNDDEAIGLKDLPSASTSSATSGKTALSSSGPASVRQRQNPIHPQASRPAKDAPQEAPGPKRKAKRVVLSFCDRLIAFMGLLVAVGALYWAWRGTLSAEDVSLKMLLLQCRIRYEKDPSSPGAIPPECADVLSANVKPQIQQLSERETKETVRNIPDSKTIYISGTMPDWMRAKCYNGTRALAPAYIDETTGSQILWLESFAGCITMFIIPADPESDWRIEQWMEGLVDKEKIYKPADFPFLHNGSTASEIIGCVNCKELWGMI